MRIKSNLLKLVAALVVVFFVSGCITLEIALLNSRQITKFDVDGQQLIMSGLINSKTPMQLSNVLRDNPDITEVVMLDVPGSVDDEANLKAARMIRSKGLNTRLLKESVVASGGTDFFLSGVKRYIQEGAKIGVHSWEDNLFNSGDKVAKNHPQHQLYLAYYNEVGIPESFYWFTLEAASVDDIHWMTQDEIQRYGLATH